VVADWPTKLFQLPASVREWLVSRTFRTRPDQGSLPPAAHTQQNGLQFNPLLYSQYSIYFTWKCLNELCRTTPQLIYEQKLTYSANTEYRSGKSVHEICTAHEEFLNSYVQYKIRYNLIFRLVRYNLYNLLSADHFDRQISSSRSSVTVSKSKKLFTGLRNSFFPIT
jgi:hypothetical protein